MSLTIVNPEEKDWTSTRWVIQFGGFSMAVTINLLVWANSLEEALNEAIDWASENAPGMLCNDEVSEAYNEAIANGMSEEDAIAEAEVDTTCGGNAGDYIHSDDWHCIESPDRDTLLRLRDAS